MIALTAALLLTATPETLAASSPGDIGAVAAVCARNSDCSEGHACARAKCGPRCKRDSDCRVGFCYTAVDEGSACIGETSVSSPLPRKPASSWSKQGWQKLRFGMGLGDIQSVVGVSCDAITSVGEEESECGQWPEKVAGVEPSVTLKYFDGELMSISVELTAPAALEEDDLGLTALRWKNNLRDALLAKYGKPKTEDGLEKVRTGTMVGDTIYQGIWERPGIKVLVTIGSSSASVNYYDPKRSLRAAEASLEASEERAKVDPAGL